MKAPQPNVSIDIIDMGQLLGRKKTHVDMYAYTILLNKKSINFLEPQFSSLSPQLGLRLSQFSLFLLK